MQNNETSHLPTEDAGSGSGRGMSKSFSLRLSFGGKPPADDAELQQFIDKATRLAEAAPDGKSTLDVDGKRVSVEVSRKEFRLGDAAELIGFDGSPLGADDESHSHAGPYKGTAEIRRWLDGVTTAMAVAIPVALLAVGIVTGQALDTIFYMTLSGLFISFMIKSSLRDTRSWLGSLRRAAERRVTKRL